jgi:polyribonucleotide nucleotidyltransferase
MIIRESVKVGDKEVTIETGRIAKQASGSVLVSSGETMVLVTVVGNKEARPGAPFFPLTCDYIEKTYAAGKIPGGFFKREARQRDHEVLTSRLIDRPCRPLFPDGYMCETQVIATVISADGSNQSDVLAMVGASAAIHISPLPWAGPIAGVRVARVDGKHIANPTYQEQEESDCELIVSASKDAIVMVEGEAKELSEADLIAAIQFGHESVQGVLELIEKLREAVGKEKWPFTPATREAKIDARVKEVALARVLEACNIAEKHPRYGRFSEIKKEVTAELAGEFPDSEGDIKSAYEDLRYNTMRAQVLDDKRRVDGRDYKTVRPIAIEVSLLPRVHGSTLFTRGETQSIVTATLGTRQDEQKIDGLTEEYYKPFLLHYNFPPYSVGETKFLRGPGRREIGHGTLAERALTKVLPSREDFPYTMRIVSEITESNGSSSMATVCGGSLAMMDAGVPIKTPVAGVAMGLIMEGEKYAVLTDILGDEDHLGDMDFKVCGTDKGITAIQMDIKVDGLSQEIMHEALEQAREGRLHILSKMNEIMATPRPELSKYAPRIATLKVKPDQIRVVIGPGGKMIKAITDQTGAKIDISDDGTVSIASPDGEALKKAIAIIESLTVEPEIGTKYKGIVRRVENYGSFLEIAPGKDGLLHISDMDWNHVDKVTDVMDLGDEVEVMISDIDREGRIRLSRKQLLEKPEGYVEPERKERREGGGGGRGRDGGRGGRDGGRGRRDGGGGRDGGRGGRDRDRGGRGGARAGGRDGDRDRGRDRDRDRDRGGERTRDRDSGGERTRDRDSGGERTRDRDSGGERTRDRSGETKD